MTNHLRGGEAERQVRTLLAIGPTSALTDGQLLGRFADGGGGEVAASAFEAMVGRHGPMVLGVCRGVLRDPDDAQDAFQATFLVLVRRAGSIRDRDSVASWLHGVALRVAARSRADRARRRHERAKMVANPAARAGATRDDLGPILHEALGRLPGRLRAPVVLCYLEGHTCEDAARLLRLPVGTVKSRLSRARDRLRRRLAGLDPAAATGALGSFSSPSSVAVPPRLVEATVRLSARAGGGPAGPVAASLAEGVLKAMFLTRLRFGSSAVPALAAAAATYATGRVDGDGPRAAAERATNEAGVLGLTLAGRTIDDPETLSKVRARHGGRVEAVRVALGDRVKVGDPLVVLRGAEAAAARDEFRAVYTRWRDALKLVEARRKTFEAGAIGRDALDRAWSDAATPYFNDQAAREKLVAEYGLDEGDLDVSLDGLDGPAADPQGLAAVVGKDKDTWTVRAAVAGLVTLRDVVPGNTYRDSDVLMIITPQDHIQVVANVREADLGKVRVGQAMEARFPAPHRDLKLRGRVDFVGAEMSKDTRTFPIRVTIPNPKGILRGGMSLRLDLDPWP